MLYLQIVSLLLYSTYCDDYDAVVPLPTGQVLAVASTRDSGKRLDQSVLQFGGEAGGARDDTRLEVKEEKASLAPRNLNKLVVHCKDPFQDRVRGRPGSAVPVGFGVRGRVHGRRWHQHCQVGRRRTARSHGVSERLSLVKGREEGEYVMVQKQPKGRVAQVGQKS